MAKSDGMPKAASQQTGCADQNIGSSEYASTAVSQEAARRQWAMGVLARASAQQLSHAWAAWSPQPAVREIRGPEAGLAMVRGRIGGGGGPFNVGEATVARASVAVRDPQLGDAVGHAYVLGRDLEHARLAAVFDALWTVPGRRDAVEQAVIVPLERTQAEERVARDRETASTEVNFFTVSRERAQ